MELYTPGHSAYTDTLIMYALAEASRNRLRRVSGRGYFYTLVVEDLTVNELSQRVSDVYKRYEPRLVERLSRLLGEREIRSLSRELSGGGRLAEYLKELTSPGHSFQEGRFGGGSTFKLPLMPVAGKYLRTDLTLFEKYDASRPYNACAYCQALAMLGLAIGALTVRYEGSNVVASRSTPRGRRPQRTDRSSIVVATLTFKGEVDGKVVESLIDYYVQLSSARGWLQEALARCVDKLSTRLFGYLALMGMDDRLIVELGGSNASWATLVTLFEKVRVVQVRGYGSVELDAILASLADLIAIDDKLKMASRGRLARVCESLLRECSVESLEKLFDALSTRRLSDVYSFARSAYSDLRGNFSASELVEALARLCTGAW